MLGVSGGADSLCLMDLLHRLKFNIIVAHFNHRLRFESEQEAVFVANEAERRGVPYRLASGEVQREADRLRMSIEETARKLRYEFLFRIAVEEGAQAVATAHHADDQVETVLMHLLRGAGTTGLQGMKPRTLIREWSVSIPLIRPLLGVWRDEILAYCQERGLAWVEDKSNLDVSFFRNRLRQELIPQLESLIPGARQRLAQTAAIMREDEALLDKLTMAEWQRCCLMENPGLVRLDRQKLSALETGLKRRIFRLAMAKINPLLRDVDFDTVHRMMALADSNELKASLDLPGAQRLELDGDCLSLRCRDASPFLPHEWPQMPGLEALSLDKNDAVRLAFPWCMSSETVQREAGFFPQVADDHEAWLDAEQLVFPLEVRACQVGERFSPLGMPGKSIKFSDLFINRKIPLAVRKRYPVVYSQGMAVWVPGFPPAHACRITKDTRLLLHLKIEK